MDGPATVKLSDDQISEILSLPMDMITEDKATSAGGSSSSVPSSPNLVSEAAAAAAAAAAGSGGGGGGRQQQQQQLRTFCDSSSSSNRNLLHMNKVRWWHWHYFCEASFSWSLALSNIFYLSTVLLLVAWLQMLWLQKTRTLPKFSLSLLRTIFTIVTL